MTQSNTGIIKSILDTDLYKLTMQQAVLKLYPDAMVEYRFKNRGEHKFSKKFGELFTAELHNMSKLSITDSELEFIAKMPFIQPWYVDFLRAYKFNPSEVEYLVNDGELDIVIKGPWYRTILWEVPLMAMISEIYFKLENEDIPWDMSQQKRKLELKSAKLMAAGCSYADFGTRRRRSYEVQDFVVSNMKKHYWFAGTSNVHLAHKHGIKAIGTMAHEWVQGISALESMNHPNRFMMKKWTEVYGCSLGIALTDTYGSNSFFKDFNKTLSSIFDGVRHDSGSPFDFIEKVVNHYKEIGVDHRTKSIVFSDGLNADIAAEIQKECDKAQIKCSFGIGTSFTNDFDSKPLNMVIKLWSVNGAKVVKLSDISGKENGDPKAVEFMKYLHK